MDEENLNVNIDDDLIFSKFIKKTGK